MTNIINGPEKAAGWFTAGEWANGLQLKVHQSVDVPAFFSQYSKNRKCWELAFAYLRDTDLNSLVPGKYLLDGEHVYVSIAEGNTKAPEDARWEAHIKYIDVQYVISGKEIIGVAPLSKAISIEPFGAENDVGFYRIPEPDCKYYVAEPGTFFLFFPQDAHRPGIRTGGSSAVKKAVIKIAVV